MQATIHTMTAQDLIAMLAEDSGLNPNALTAEDCRDLRSVLEDGAALAALSITDEDQEAVEAAHAALDERRLTYTVNATGLAEIKEFLADNHKLGGDHFTSDMLRAWAADAEFSLAEGNGAAIELSARDSVNGRTQTFEISAAGLDAQNVEIDE